MLARFALAAGLLGAAVLFAGDPSRIQQGAKPKPDVPNGRYEIDPVHSSVIFKINHMGISNFYGRFDKVGGKLLVDGENPAESMITISIDPNSIDTNNADRDNHLKGADFFNVAEFPEMSFDSEKVTPKGTNKFEVTGTFKLHGVEKTITVPVEQTGSSAGGPMGARIGYEARFTIKRADYGLDYHPEALGSDVEIVLCLQGGRK